MAAVTACLFIGPTLARRDVDAALGATCLPPARQGDVHRAVSLLRPQAIGIVDGYFRFVPSVWHKEILWAIDQGVHVFGAASMGALRAAELQAFGMHGVGRIFAAYRAGRLGPGEDGTFEDDDEVAVVHGPAEAGYPPISEAMVNIRCTLFAAAEQGVIDEPTRGALVALAKSTYFPDRSYPALLASAHGAGLDPAALGRFERWLPRGRVDQKRADALALVDAMCRFLAAGPGPARPAFRFERTSLWERGMAQATPRSWHAPETRRVLEELRLRGGPYDELRREAALALVPPPGSNHAGGGRPFAEQLDESHRAPLHVDDLLGHRDRERRADDARDRLGHDLLEQQILARLQGSPLLAELEHRAADKHARIGERTDVPDVDAFSELQLLQLRDWYFSQVLSAPMPDDLDARVAAWGYHDVEHFHRALLHEYAYRQSLAQASVAPAGTAAQAR